MSTTMTPTDQLAIAIDAVVHASHVANAVQADLDRVRGITKDDRSPVTVADFAVQAIVAMHLKEHMHQPLIIGEERASAMRQPEQAAVLAAVLDAVQTVRPNVTADDVLEAIDACDHDGTADAYWTLDPVDGTKGFLRGQQYAIALAHLEHSEVRVGVMGCPNLPADQSASLTEPDAAGTLYAAAVGQGATQRVLLLDGLHADRPVRCEPFDASRGLRMCESVESSHSRQSDTARIVEQIGEAGPPARLDSQCKYAVVARGQADAYLRLPTRADYREKIWDHAAGMLIAAEAGAIVTDARGEALDFSHGSQLERNRGIIAAEPSVHGRIVDVIKSLGIDASW